MMDEFYVHPTASIDANVTIGHGTHIWHYSHIMPGATIGSHCVLGQNVFIGEGVNIGKNVKIQNNVSVYVGVEIGDEVFIGPSVVFTNVINPRSIVERKNEFQTTLVRKGVTVGANATIMCGLELGRFSFIGAGAVITKSIDPYALVVGNPGMPVGWMCELGHRLTFGNNQRAICDGDGSIYVLENNHVSKEQ